ncbi:MAG: DUF349 domain-containing protein [Bacteroidales bacterium]|jgi:hypothetical protein|nr:DUF349 domain-containing protein [Bacteroidales bacterium]
MSENDLLPVNNQEEVASEVNENVTESINNVIETDEVNKTDENVLGNETAMKVEAVEEDETDKSVKTTDVDKTEEPIEIEKQVEPEAVIESENENVEELTVLAEDENRQLDESMEVIDEDIMEMENDDEQDDELAEDIDYSAFTRDELIHKLSDLLQEENIEKIKPAVSAIKVAFIEKTKLEYKNIPVVEGENNVDDITSPDREPVDALEQRFNEVFNVYREKKAKYLEQLEEQKKINLEQKQQILEKLKELINSDEPLKATYDKFKELQDQWKEIGAVPKSEVNNLWQNYHFLVEKFFDKVKINRELRDLDTKKNLEAKISLCEKAEELILEKSIMKSFKKLQSYHQEWKEIGPVPADKREELWERFKTATDKINARRKEYYFQLKDQQDGNYAAKLALIEEAKKLVEELPSTLKEWQSRGDQLNELFKAWKSVGSASKSQNDKIWEEFKGIMDGFFVAKKEFFAKMKDEQFDNYNLKLDLCTQAEAVKDSTNWGETTQILINLQKEWKKIGPTPKRMSDKIWKRFRGACDEFFKRKEEHFANINEHGEENLNKKKALVEEINNLVIPADNPHDGFEHLKKLQRDWMEIGHVPRKDKDTIQNAYRKAVNEKLDELKTLGVEVANLNFKNKIENIKSNPNANHFINKERGQIFNKIQGMKEDVSLWENNIGFLSRSANAELLKAEFEKKIEKAKKEIVQLEEKLRILDEQEA